MKDEEASEQAVTIGALDDFPLLEAGPDGSMVVPGVGRIPADMIAGRSRWLGRSTETGPWVYLNEFPRGHTVRYHFHDANRTEILIRGSIMWHEPNTPSHRYDAPAFSYVEAGQVYGFDVLEDAQIVVQFDGPPVINVASNRARQF